jgi:diadenosine tetraphosphate (Ap4A) HIT family hydrolase
MIEANCVFCNIVKGDEPSHQIWEDADHLAFLSIFPNTPGVSVVIPKAHYESYIFAVSMEVMVALMKASRKVAHMIDRAYEDVGRTGVVFEGFGVNHLHTKLFPLHGTGVMHEWRQINAPQKIYSETYEGYISSHDGPRADEEELKEAAERIHTAKT